MSDKQYIIQKDHINLILCPLCHSPHVYTNYTCPKCKTRDIESIKIIEHPHCGYTGAKKNFVSGTKIICPKCKTELDESKRVKGNRSKSHYRMIGSTFQCVSCDIKFDKPSLLHTCQNCEYEFDYKESTYVKAYNYEIPIKTLKELRITDKILVLSIEDSVEDFELIRINLEKSEHSFNIESVTTGEEGLTKIKEKFYDIVLLDYNLPDMKGKDFLEELKKRKIKIPVMVLTGTDDREIAVNSMKYGASDFLVKSAELFEKLPVLILKMIQRQ